MLHELMVIWFEWVRDWGYWGVFVLMALESTIVPVPSEIIVPPAAYWAAQGKMSFWGVVTAATIGSYVGSALSYWVSQVLGLPLLNRFGKYVLLGPDKLALAENWLKRYGTMGLFTARLLPVVRHLISIPAGILKMNFATFSIVTTVGAGIWCWILAWFGERVIGDRPDLLQNPDALVLVMKEKFLFFALALIVLFGLYVFVKSRKSRPLEQNFSGM